MKPITKFTPLWMGMVLLITLCFTSCRNDKEDERIPINLKGAAAQVNEGSEVVIRLTLAKSAKKDEYVTLSVSSSTAGFGTDYGIDDLLFLEEEFSVLIPKDSTGASVALHALPDFEQESDEKITFTINRTSDGLLAGDQKTLTVTIVDVENYPDENRAISFDGVDDYIDLGNIYDNVTLPVTISVWVWVDPNVPKGSLPIIDSQDGLPYYNGFSLITSNISHVGVQYGDGQGENSEHYRRAKSALFNPVAGRWVNMTGVMRSATDMSCYLNGIDMGGTYAGSSDLPLKSNSPQENAKVGILFNNGRTLHFQGKLDELRIWNRALAEAEIQKFMITKLDHSAPGLIGYWDFNESTGDAVIDKSASKFNGTLKNSPSRVASEVPVK
ncbi:Concanavalin A-like lectin/glucanases superfamily protein [Chryseolinea serpens]|uniref:Concanavalin A-like lectin/glucanases superfamily protein n=1 Tax=Chryseolinea serpens TaxID=947013 RepID=A0A1M5XD99_9BACT|nr:LamG domain-containing protein [Chryseolinea serpens]SHH97791.1 Concanavalin A-like lectin/glucanases superfamily protein [Chryseolinea serpens]